MGRIHWMRVPGPLREYADGFLADLVEQGYARSSVDNHGRVLAQLSRWLGRKGWGAGELTEQAITQFQWARRRAGYVTSVSTRSLELLLDYLRSCGVAPRPATPVELTPVEELLADYRGYLSGGRGLAAGTVGKYISEARVFLAQWEDAPRPALAALTAGQVVAFVLRGCQERRVESAKNMIGGLRSLLRFLYAKSLVPLPLADAVPTVAGWRRSLPKGLDPQTVTRLLASCDRRTRVGRRDYAILLLLVRLGLRAGEVAALGCDDVDWRAGELLIRAGKGRRVDRLPIPVDVGEALVGYLCRGRPHSSSHALFLRVQPPLVGLTAHGIQQVVRHACVRAGLPECGSHRLRHTAATELLRAGAPLSEIAQLLRHRSVTTTTIYAKVDRSSLSTVAQPWPGGAA